MRRRDPIQIEGDWLRLEQRSWSDRLNGFWWTALAFALGAAPLVIALFLPR